MLVIRSFFLSLLMWNINEGHEISKRYLLFPRQAPTRYQFIAGIGIPADLEYESLTVGYVLKSMFFLPWNATTFRENPFIPEYQRRTHKMTRWSVYTGIERAISSYGYNGKSCMLLAICEANLLKFTKRNTILDELLHIVLTPSSTIDKGEDRSNEYFNAEQYGQKGDCERFQCNFSFLRIISTIL